MFKATPNPPETDPTSAHAGQASQKLDEAAERALSFYLDPKPQTSNQKEITPRPTVHCRG